MKGLEIFFPPFDTIVCDPLLSKSFLYDNKEKPGTILGYGLLIEKYMPENSALFLHDKNIVAIYLNGRLTFDKIKLKKLSTLFGDFLKGNMKKGE